MTGSFNDIDYRLRPAKHAERLMLVELFRSFRLTKAVSEYRYIGMGSVAFIDHRMMHRHLGISSMISIEDVPEDRPEIRERFSRNCPLSCVNLDFRHSRLALADIAGGFESLVWLDYDGKLERSMANDLSILAGKVPAGSFVGVTFRAGFPTDKDARPAELDRLRNEFPEFVTDRTKPSDLDGVNLSELGRFALGSLFQKALSDEDAQLEPEKQRRIFQVCYFRYRDGAIMATVGWLVLNDEILGLVNASHLDRLSFFRSGSEPFVIKIPLVTPYEVHMMERGLPGDLSTADLRWIPEQERRSFADLYRFLPTFGVLENI